MYDALLQIVLTALEGAGDAFSRRKPPTADQAERQRVLGRNNRAFSLFVVFAVFLSAVLL